MDENHRKRIRIGLTGVIIGFIALASSLLSSWIADVIDPPPEPSRPIKEVVVDAGDRFKNWINKRVSDNHNRDESVNASATRHDPIKKSPSEYLPPIVIIAGIVALAFGIFSLLLDEKRIYSKTAILLGIAAVVVQHELLYAAVFLGIILFVLFLIYGLGLA